MPEPRDTDERLRYYLNNRQPDRERMCIELLATVPGYKDLEPRRPEGGPDGGRDLQGTYNGMKLFGAVGFKNDANGSPQQTREILAKFADDLKAALAAEPHLMAFVFLTNIDLTPGQRDQLKQSATNSGIQHVEIFWRERLRLLLDRSEGYATRLSYLDINLSDAEQKDFFSRFGNEIRNLVVGKLESVEQRIEEILYRNWLRGRCRSINVNVKLHQLYRIEGHDHEPYRFVLRLHRVRMYGEGEMLLGCFSSINQNEHRADFEVKRFIYSDTGMLPNERKSYKHFASGTRALFQPFNSVQFGIAIGRGSPLVADYGFVISELGEYVIDFYCDSAWAKRIERVEVWYDDYLVYEFINDGQHLRAEEWKHEIMHWPEDASHLKHRPVQYWSGWPHGLDRVCRRKRVGEW